MDHLPLLVQILLIAILGLILIQEAVNGFHDVSNSITTVIYSNAMQPVPAVLLAATCNFFGVLVGGTAVAFSLIYLLPANMIAGIDNVNEIALFLALVASALIWNFGTWWLGIPNSTTHAYIGAILGSCMANAYVMNLPVLAEINWGSAEKVLTALVLSPVIGFALGYALFVVVRKLKGHQQSVIGDSERETPKLAERAILIAGSASVSLLHGSNDGQKSIGLIMLVLFGLFPAMFGVNPGKLSPQDVVQLHQVLSDVRTVAIDLKNPKLEKTSEHLIAKIEPDVQSDASQTRDMSASRITREDLFSFYIQVKHIVKDSDAREMLSVADGDKLFSANAYLAGLVEHVPVWVLLMAAIVLGTGTMFGYKRIVTTLGERMGSARMGVAQGTAVQVSTVASIAMADFGGLPVSTTHVMTSAVVGTVSGTPEHNVNRQIIKQILFTWVTTLPATLILSFGLGIFFYRVASWLS
jgi:low-affinity inorganic phosphate transporter